MAFKYIGGAIAPHATIHWLDKGVAKFKTVCYDEQEVYEATKAFVNQESSMNALADDFDVERYEKESAEWN